MTYHMKHRGFLPIESTRVNSWTRFKTKIDFAAQCRGNIFDSVSQDFVRDMERVGLTGSEVVYRRDQVAMPLIGL